jgi:hypothetical protein
MRITSHKIKQMLLIKIMISILFYLLDKRIIDIVNNLLIWLTQKRKLKSVIIPSNNNVLKVAVVLLNVSLKYRMIIHQETHL